MRTRSLLQYLVHIYKNRYATTAADFRHARRRYQQRALLIKDTTDADS